MLHVKTMVYAVAINSLENILVLQQTHSDVTIGPARAHGNRQKNDLLMQFESQL